MAPIERLAFIGNSLPRRCGIATFTTDEVAAITTKVLAALSTDAIANFEFKLTRSYRKRKKRPRTLQFFFRSR